VGTIYTKTGDLGKTNVGGGRRLGKDDPLIDVLGDFDELNSVLGLVRAFISGYPKAELEIVFDDLRLIQGDIFSLSSMVAGSKDSLLLKPRITWLERRIDVLDSELEDSGRFVYPGGHPIAGCLFLARAVCRRTERSYIKFRNRKKDGSSKALTKDELIVYLNRLSDYLFVLARWVNLKVGIKEERWKLSKSSKSG
jgi:cob(I)alamin adenosyltransferase